MITSNQLAAILAMTDPIPPLAVLRRHAPVAKLRDSSTEFVVTGYEAARQVLGNPRATRVPANACDVAVDSLISMSGAEHRAARHRARALFDFDAMLALLADISVELHALEDRDDLSITRDVAPLVDRVTRRALFGDGCPYEDGRPTALIPAIDRPDGLLETSLRGGLGTQQQQLVNIVSHHCRSGRLAVPREENALHEGLEQAYRRLPAVPSVRVITGDPIRLGSVLVPAGSQVFVMLLAANDDAPAGRHLTFSSGPHGCLGEQVARAQAIRMLRTLAADWQGTLAIVLPGDTRQPLHGPSDVLLRRAEGAA